MAAAVNCIFLCVILTTSIQTPRITSARLRILAVTTWSINDVYFVQVNFISTSLIQLNAFVLRSGNDYLYCVNFDVRYELHTESRMFPTQPTKPPAPLTGCRRIYTTFVAYLNTALSICVCVCVCVWDREREREEATNALFSDALNRQDYASLVVVEWNMFMDLWWKYTDKIKPKYSDKCLFRCHFVCQLAWDRTRAFTMRVHLLTA